MKTYITFGQDHIHQFNGKIFNKDCVAVINHEKPEEGRELAFKYFGPKFCFEYPEKHFKMDSMHYYPRGFIEVNIKTN